MPVLNLSGLKDYVTPAALLFLVGLTVYNQYHGSVSPAPPAPHLAPDPVAVKLGSDYGRAIRQAAADTLEASAARSWTSTAQAAEQSVEDFDDRLAKAWKPVAGEITRRYGPTSDQSVDFARAAELRKFWRDVADGVRKEATP